MSDSPAPTMTCSHCGTTFPAAEQDERCPTCLRASGLVRAADTSPPAKTGGGFGPVLLGLVALGVAIWSWAGSRAPEPSPSPAKSARPPQASSVLASVPTALRLEPQAVGGAIQLVADRLPREAAAVVDAVRQARTKGLLPARGDEDDLLGAPRSAASLSGALDGETTPPAGGFELATLAGAVLTARLGPGVTYGVDPAHPGTATSLLERRYLVRHGEASWMALDGEAVGTVVVLSDAEFLGNALALRALSALLEDDAELAAKASQQARALAPEDAAIVFAAGQVQLATGLVDMGLSTMERAAKIQSDAQTWIALGIAAMHAEKPFKAHQYLSRAATTDPRLADPHLGLAQLALERLATTPRSGQGQVLGEVERHVAAAEAADDHAPGLGALKAQLAALAGDMEGAERLLREEAKRFPDDPTAWLNLAQFLEGEERDEAALAALEEGAREANKSAPLHQALGAVLAQEGRLEEALSALEAALAIDPSDAELRPQLAQLHHALGDEGKARGLLEDQISIHGDDWTTKLLLAQLELDAGETRLAAEHIDAVLDTRPDHPEALLVRYALALRTDKGVSDARANAIRVVGSRTEVAQILLEQGFAQEGERLLREAIERSPEDGLAPVLLAAVLVATDREREAEALKIQALATAASDADRDAMASHFDAAFEQAREARAESAAQLAPP
jgi:tetratricopeptide (TPR) repeat protein